MAERKTYAEIMDDVWKATEPNVQNLSAAMATGNDSLLALAQLRNARDLIHGLLASRDDRHMTELRDQTKGSLQKLDKNIARLVSDIARTIDNLQDCNCKLCRKQAAPYN